MIWRLDRAVSADTPVDMKVLHAKIGELALENDFLEDALTKVGIAGRKAMIDRDQQASQLARQANGSEASAAMSIHVEAADGGRSRSRTDAPHR